MRSGIDLFKEWKAKEKANQQICFIISDGRFNKDVKNTFFPSSDQFVDHSTTHARS